MTGAPPENPHFAAVSSWETAEEMLAFRPRRPQNTLGYELESLSVHVADHKQRELPFDDRSLEAHYGGFVVTQARRGTLEARRWALTTSYGPTPRPAAVCGHEGRIYELGPEPPIDDVDGRSPAVAVWADGDMLYLVASGELSAGSLLDIAASMYSSPDRGNRPRRRAP